MLLYTGSRKKGTDPLKIFPSRQICCQQATKGKSTQDSLAYCSITRIFLGALTGLLGKEDRFAVSWVCGILYTSTPPIIIMKLLALTLLANTGTVAGSKFLPPHARSGYFAASNPELTADSEADFPEASIGYALEVPLDHFAEDHHLHFEDHFYIDSTYFDEKSGPIFVEMGGEGPCGGARAGETHKR